MDHLGEDGTYHGTHFGIKKCRTKFSFCGIRQNHTHDVAEDINFTIHGRYNGVGEGRFNEICGGVTEVKLSSGAAAVFGFGQVGSATVDIEARFASVEKYDVIWVCGTLIYKMGGGL